MNITNSIQGTLLRTALFILVLIAAGACKKSFLDVTNPATIPAENFPSSVADIDLMLNDVYGRMRHTYYNADIFNKAGIGPDHTADQGFNGAGFNEWMLNVLLPVNGTVTQLWNRSYAAISRVNATLDGIERFRATGLSADIEKLVALQEGQALFMRAYYYYYLVQFYGYSPLTTPADKQNLGVPLRTKIPATIDETAKERATIGEIWNQIIADLERAEVLMAGKPSWDAANRSRVNLWTVKAFLGKAYLFSLEYTKARDKLKDVIDNSGKSLVSYNTLRNMFNGANEFNNESLLEINYTDVINNSNANDITLNSITQYGKFISPSYVSGTTEKSNGFGNLFIHDGNIRRFGFTLPATTAAEQKDAAYIAQSLLVRTNKTADPRLFVGTLQPYVDSIFVENAWRKVAKSRAESFNLNTNKAWCHRKYTLIDRTFANNIAIPANMYVLRLADVYLLYAEALVNTGNNVQALEYINKVKRRAYDLPVNTPSSIDYASLTAATMAAPGDHLANDPLKYERWAELFAEGHWWLDVRRWRIGDMEAQYYQRVKSGTLVWANYKYSLPIPESELLGNSKIQRQNEGY